MTESENGVKLMLGDCLERLRELPDCSVDSVVTDPPYGLSFMGKKWDYDVPSVEVWAECLRVLKPGGHLLAFAGTRTQHRMAVRIEDAGFEIRDMIAWVYSTGFPKSHNFGCKCSRDALPYSHEKAIQSKQATECKMHPLRDSNVSPSLDIGEGRGEVLQPCLSQSGASIEGREQLSTSKVRGGESSMEGRRDLLAETRELQADQACPVSGGVSAYGSEGRLHNGASSDNGADNGAVPIEDQSRASCEPRPAGQPTGESGVIPKQRGAQEGGVEADQVCAKCGKLTKWQGWGTALKPALEPITVARKPLVGTVAANVLAHGTGGINVDGCRVGTETITQRLATVEGGKAIGAKAVGVKQKATGETTTTIGRWPANLIHDGSDEVVGLFPVTTSGGGDKHGRKASSFCASTDWKAFKGTSSGGDSGSAARFFYCAKASKKDRDEGLDSSRTVKHATGLCKEENMALVGSLQKATCESTVRWGIDESGGSITGLCPLASLSTTLTAISKITTSEIFNSWTPSPTSESMAGVKSETANGGSHAENVEKSKASQQTTTSENQAGSAHGVSGVVSKMLSSISDAENWTPATNFHATVKPTALMRYLCRLVTPPEGIVLDPFMGSGSTGKAAMLEGFQFVGIERDAEYFEIATSRIAVALPMQFQMAT